MNKLIEQNKYQEFVVVADGKPVTDSLKVAKHFGKMHKNVLAAIRKVECSEEFNRLNFKPIKYIDAKGRIQKAVQMTERGFLFIALAFTGKKAAAMREAFINAFMVMSEQIKSGQMDLWKQMQELVAREVESKVKASFGSHLMLQRKREIPLFETEYEKLSCLIQPTMLN